MDSRSGFDHLEDFKGFLLIVALILLLVFIAIFAKEDAITQAVIITAIALVALVLSVRIMRVIQRRRRARRH